MSAPLSILSQSPLVWGWRVGMWEDGGICQSHHKSIESVWLHILHLLEHGAFSLQISSMEHSLSEVIKVVAILVDTKNSGPGSLTWWRNTIISELNYSDFFLYIPSFNLCFQFPCSRENKRHGSSISNRFAFPQIDVLFSARQCSWNYIWKDLGTFAF